MVDQYSNPIHQLIWSNQSAIITELASGNDAAAQPAIIGVVMYFLNCALCLILIIYCSYVFIDTLKVEACNWQFRLFLVVVLATSVNMQVMQILNLIDFFRQIKDYKVVIYWLMQFEGVSFAFVSLFLMKIFRVHCQLKNQKENTISIMKQVTKYKRIEIGLTITILLF